MMAVKEFLDLTGEGTMLRNHKIKKKFGVLNFVALLLIFLALAGAGALLYLNGRYIFIDPDLLIIYYSVAAFVYICVSILIIVILGSKTGSYLSLSIIRLKDAVGKMAAGENVPVEHYSLDELSELAEALRGLAAARSVELDELKQASGAESPQPGLTPAPEISILANPVNPFAKNEEAPEPLHEVTEVAEEKTGNAGDADVGAEEKTDEAPPSADEAGKVLGDSALPSAHDENADASDAREPGADYSEIISHIKEPAALISIGAAETLSGAMSLSTATGSQAEKIRQYAGAIKTATELAAQNASLSSETLSAIRENVLIAGHNTEDARRLTDAMKSIVHSSQQISRVIKIIDDLAFKTNILSLNASVEAARAGQGGKGFGVIADEIRSLSTKSADAAKETAELIKISMDSADEIDDMVKTTSKNASVIEQNSRTCSENVDKLSLSSKYQSDSIRDIGAGLEQISALVNENFALAERSAEAARNMAKHSEELHDIIGRFDRENAS